MKKVLTLILLFLLVSCGDTFSNDNSKKEFKKIQVSKDDTGGTSGGDANDPPPPPPPGGGN
ncbi:MAG: hypothetical protein KDD94_03175 [Calditrichaeota bacterium]|nr:hypothetical protein [Calditrichota bacterium]